MEIPKPIALFASNYSDSSPGSKRFSQIRTTYEDKAESIPDLDFVFSSNDTETIKQLDSLQDRIAIFHFEGRDKNYKRLLEACQLSKIGILTDFLSELPKLRFVFLSGGATEDFVNTLEESGVQAIVMSSRAISLDMITEFAKKFYEHFFKGEAVQLAATKAREAIGIEEGSKNRIFVGVRGTENGRVWRLQPHIEGSLEPKTVGWYPEENLPNSPFPGNRPYSRNEAGIFLGRRSQTLQIGERLKTNKEKSILLLHGQSGIGKSSLLNSGLLSYITSKLLEKCRIIELNGRNNSDLFNTLCNELRVSKEISPNEIWKSANISNEKAIIVTIDQCEDVFSFRTQREDARDDFQKVVESLRSFVLDINSVPFRRVIICCRTVDKEQCDIILGKFNLSNQRELEQIMPLSREQVVEVINGFSTNLERQSRYSIGIENGLAELIADDLLKDKESSIAPFLQSILVTLWEQEQGQGLQSSAFTIANYQKKISDESLFEIFHTQQLNLLYKQNDLYKRSGFDTRLLTFQFFLFQLTQSRSIEETRNEFPYHFDTIWAISHSLKDLYLFTDTDAKQGQDTRLGYKPLLAPIVRGLYPNSRSLELTHWLFVNVFLFLPAHVKQGILNLLRCLWKWLLPPLRACQNVFRAIWSFISRNLPFALGIALFLVLLTPVYLALRWHFTESDLKTHIGNLQSSSNFQLKRISGRESRFFTALEWLTNSHPLMPKDVIFTPIHILSLHYVPREAGKGGKVLDINFGSDSNQLYFYDSFLGLNVSNSTLSSSFIESLKGKIRRLTVSPTGEKQLQYVDPPSYQIRSNDAGITLTLSITDEMKLFSFSQTGKFLGLVTLTDSIFIFDANSGQIYSFRTFDTDPLNAFAIDEVNHTFAINDRDNTVQIWSFESYQKLHSFSGHTAFINSLVFSQDGQRLLSASSDNTIRLLDISRDLEEHVFDDSEDAVRQAIFDYQKALIIAGSDDDIIRIWDAKTFTLLDTIQANQSGVTAVAISHDGRWVASGGWDGSIHVWAITSVGYLQP